MIDWSDNAARQALLDRIGLDAYTAAHGAYLAQSAPETVNGYGVRPIKTVFGTMWEVTGTRTAFETVEEARDHAAGLKPGG